MTVAGSSNLNNCQKIAITIVIITKDIDLKRYRLFGNDDVMCDVGDVIP